MSATRRKKLLIVYHSQTGRTQALAEAALAGAQELDDVETVLQRAFDTSTEDLASADALLIGTPENFGYMAGAIKDLFDRTFYALEGKMVGRPYALFVSAGNDGTGAMTQTHRIALGYGWRKVHPGVLARIEVDEESLAAARELGQTLAAGLSAGIY